MIDLLDIAPVVQAIKTNAPIFASRVYETVIDRELAIDREQSPTAFVYLSSDKSMENTTLLTVRQQMLSMITVAIVIRRQASRTDQYSTTDNQTLRQCRNQVFNALIGLELGSTALEHVSGELNDKNPITLDWRDQFMTYSYIAT